MSKTENQEQQGTKHSPFEHIHPGDYDGSVEMNAEELLQRLQNGELDEMDETEKHELLSRAIARVAYLSAENKVLRKNRGMEVPDGVL